MRGTETIGGDRVIETVAENGWTCRKWASGWCECYTAKYIATEPTVAGQHINFKIDRPSVMVATRTGNCNIGVNGQVAPYLEHTNMTATPLDIWVNTPKAIGESTIYIFISLYGYWKV